MKTHMEGYSEHNRGEVASKEKQFNGAITPLLRAQEWGKFGAMRTDSNQRIV